jgi:hypothetical protein
MTSTNPSHPRVLWIVLLWTAIILIWAGSGVFLVEKDNRGTFGDMFGAVNSLFTGLAFATLIYTAWMQHEELSLQRQELIATRTEITRQADEFAQQSAIFEVQRFESTFFALLRSHSDIVSAMEARNELGTLVARRECFAVWYSRLKESHSRLASYPDEVSLPTVQQVYAEFYRHHQAELGHYFRHLYHIFKFIQSSDNPNRKMYASLVRAQLSAYEQIMLFYNCLSMQGIKKFKPLVEQFAVLENMPTTLLIDPGRHCPLFESSAYGDNAA